MSNSTSTTRPYPSTTCSIPNSTSTSNLHLNNVFYPNNHNNMLYLPLIYTPLYLNHEVLPEHNHLNTLPYPNHPNILLYLSHSKCLQ